jgi:uncharacterized membrane protein HdeD (DUF308 family)
VSDVGATSRLPRRASAAQVADYWWLMLVTGILWLLLAIIVFRFDWTTVSSISILFGLVMLGAAFTEVLAIPYVHGWWRLLHLGLAAAFVVIGIVAFVNPGGTFTALAAVMSFYFVIKGTFDIAVGIVAREQREFWWATLILGVAEVLLGFWAAGNFGHKAILLVVWVGAAALTRGFSEIFAAFALRRARTG